MLRALLYICQIMAEMIATTVMMEVMPMPTIELRPQPGPQEQFLASPADIVFYGGS